MQIENKNPAQFTEGVISCAKSNWTGKFGYSGVQLNCQDLHRIIEGGFGNPFGGAELRG